MAGWGHNTDFSKINPHLAPLYEVQVKIRDPQYCIGKGVDMDKEHELCAGKPGKKDSCAGDSGGPLMIKEKNNRYILNSPDNFIFLKNGKKGLQKLE